MADQFTEAAAGFYFDLGLSLSSAAARGRRQAARAVADAPSKSGRAPPVILRWTLDE